MSYEFPKKFLFGASISDYQHFGNSPCDLQPRTTSYHLKYYKKDFELLKELSLNSFRTSVEWARIETEKDRINEGWLEFYKEYFGMLKDMKIKTFVTLHHFTNPRWIHKEGGWLSPKILEKFNEYVDLVSKELKGYVDYYLIINEPVSYVNHAYFLGTLPPNKKDFFLKSLFSLKNICLTIRNCCKTIKRNDPYAKVSFTHDFSYSQPYKLWNPLHHLLNILYKKMRFYFLDSLKKDVDFIALNYYSKVFHKFTLKELQAEYYPQGLRIMCKELYKKYKKPIIITENGFPSTNDKLKSSFLLSHLFEVWKSINLDKVKINGYLWWSFLHGYEWFIGYEPNFGLINVDIGKSLKRRITPTALIYKKVIENGISDEAIKKVDKKIKFKNYPAIRYKEIMFKDALNLITSPYT